MANKLTAKVTFHVYTGDRVDTSLTVWRDHRIAGSFHLGEGEALCVAKCLADGRIDRMRRLIEATGGALPEVTDYRVMP